MSRKLLYRESASCLPDHEFRGCCRCRRTKVVSAPVESGLIARSLPSSGMWLYIIAALAAVCAVYAYLLAQRLERSRFDRQKLGQRMPSDEELLQDSENWRDVDVLQEGSQLSKATGKRYLITGSSGNFGGHAVQLLHSRGERVIYCLDIAPLPAAVAALDGVHYRKCDISDLSAVQEVFREARPDV